MRLAYLAPQAPNDADPEAQLLWRLLLAVGRVTTFTPTPTASPRLARSIGLRQLPTHRLRHARCMQRLGRAVQADLVVVAEPTLAAAAPALAAPSGRVLWLGDWPCETAAPAPPGTQWWCDGPPTRAMRRQARRAGVTLSARPRALALPPLAEETPGDGVLTVLEDPQTAPAQAKEAARIVARLRQRRPAAVLVLSGPGLAAIQGRLTELAVPALPVETPAAAVAQAAAVLIPSAAVGTALGPDLLAVLAMGRPAVAVAPGNLASGLRRQLAGDPEQQLAAWLASPASAAAAGRRLAEFMHENLGPSRLAQALASLLPAGTPGGETLQPDLEQLSAEWNPQSRLFVADYALRLAVPETAVFVQLVDQTGVVPANAAVIVTLLGEGRWRLHAHAILERQVDHTGLALAIEVWDRQVALVPIGASATEVAGGLLAVEPAGPGRAAIRAWTRGKEIAVAIDGAPTPAAATSVRRGGIHIHDIEVEWLPKGRSLTISTTRGVGKSMPAAGAWLDETAPTSPHLTRLKDSLRGRRAWLIGNGPSVRPQDLDALESEITFGFNRLYLAYGTTRLRPTFTVSADAQMIGDFGQEIVDRAGGTVFLADKEVPDVVGDYIWLRQLGSMPFPLSRRPDQAVLSGGASFFVALQLGLFMGIRDFVIYGADFRFVYDRIPGAVDKFKSVAGDGNHFIPNYRSGKAWCPPHFECIGEAYLNARLLLESEGGRIRNSTRGGLLDIFPRVRFETALRTHQTSGEQA